MGGPRIFVDENRFRATIAELENKTSFNSMYELQEAVANSEYGSSISITPANVYNYIRKWGIQLKTKAGKPGCGLAKVHTAGVVRIPRGEKWKEDTKAQEWISDVRVHMKGLCTNITGVNKTSVDKQKLGRINKMCDKLESGSLKAAIALMCVSCCAGEIGEVKCCNITSCPLYQLRPWKETDNEFANVELD